MYPTQQQTHKTRRMKMNTPSKQVVLNGKAVEFDSAIALMDDDIREHLHNKMAPCADQEFLDAYVKAHKEMYGEQFQVS
jgi:hypothetical protein